MAHPQMTDLDAEIQKTGSDSESTSGPPDAEPNSIPVEEKQDNATPIVTPTSFPPPPNGGTLAWLQVLGTFFLWMDTL